MSRAIRIGVSSCLLGEKVRHDGGHKSESYLMDTLANYFQWVSFCPEAEMGLGVPRDSMRLERRGKEVRLIVNRTGDDLTEKIQKFSEKKVQTLKRSKLSGVILKKNSPSCGMERVKVYSKGVPYGGGTGFFAAEWKKANPYIPTEEEGRLRDPVLRENWIERVFIYHRLMDLLDDDWKFKDLLNFHTCHKLVVLAHSPAGYQRLGRLVAKGKTLSPSKLAESYLAELMDSLSVPATRGRHRNVLEHMVGYFTDRLDASSRKELSTSIQDYSAGLLPLIVPITLVQHYVRIFDVSYLKSQIYLNPHPKELALRNHV